MIVIGYPKVHQIYQIDPRPLPSIVDGNGQIFDASVLPVRENTMRLAPKAGQLDL